MTTITPTHLNKVGTAYTTSDMRFRLYRKSSNWYLYDATENDKTNLGTVRDEAITKAENIIDYFLVTEAADLVDARTAKIPAGMFSARYHDSEADTPCACCGRKVGKNPKMAIVIDGGAKIVHPEDAHMFAADAGWMGCFPIGSECAKKFPAGFLTN